MSVLFITASPQDLLNEFNKRIAQKEEQGKVKTWLRHKDQVHYTHDSDNWRNDAFFKPIIVKDGLRFVIVPPEGSNISSLVYAYYHGHLTQTFLDHFDKMFTYAVSSAYPEHGDIVASPAKS